MALCLIVDDDELSCEVSADALMSLGMDTLIKTDSAEALSLCAKRMPDLIILDMKMPKIDGFTFLTTLKKLPTGKYVKIIASTGLCDTETVQKLKTAGIDGYLVKPYSMELLKEKVMKLGLY